MNIQQISNGAHSAIIRDIVALNLRKAVTVALGFEHKRPNYIEYVATYSLYS